MSRETVLALLRQREGDFVSGGEISRRLGLSRAAVWKSVDALRREGYEVEARTGRGYRLLAAPDVLTEAEIRRFLGGTRTVGRRLVCLTETDSTNLRAKQLAAEGAEGVRVAGDLPSAFPCLSLDEGGCKGKENQRDAVILRCMFEPRQLLPTQRPRQMDCGGR